VDIHEENHRHFFLTQLNQPSVPPHGQMLHLLGNLHLFLLILWIIDLALPELNLSLLYVLKES
jgi:hypothetical protein